MTIQYLIDENLSPLYQEQLRRYLPDLTVLKIGDPDVPPISTLDPEILIWCEQNNFILVTNNRRSMPVHLREHLEQNRKVPGIFVLRPKFSIGEIIRDLVFIAEVNDPDEHKNLITHIPLL